MIFIFEYNVLSRFHMYEQLQLCYNSSFIMESLRFVYQISEVVDNTSVNSRLES